MSALGMHGKKLSMNLYQTMGYARCTSYIVINDFRNGDVFAATSSRPNRLEKRARALGIVLYAIGVKEDDSLIEELRAHYAAFGTDFKYPVPDENE